MLNAVRSVARKKSGYRELPGVNEPEEKAEVRYSAYPSLHLTGLHMNAFGATHYNRHMDEAEDPLFASLHEK